MIYLETDLATFCEEHGLVVEVIRCPLCKYPYTRNRPVVTEDAFGLVTPEHGCQWQSGMFVPRGTWAAIFEGQSE